MGRDEGTRQNSMQKSQSMEECRDRPECTKDVQQKCLDFSTPTEAGAQVNIVNNATQLQARNEHCQPKSLVDTDWLVPSPCGICVQTRGASRLCMHTVGVLLDTHCR